MQDGGSGIARRSVKNPILRRPVKGYERDLRPTSVNVSRHDRKGQNAEVSQPSTFPG